MDEDGLDARILAAATRRGRRLLTISELLEEGANYKHIQYRIDHHRWARLHHTVVDVGAGPLTRFDRVLAATLAGGTASECTAVWLYGIGDFSPATIEVDIPYERRIQLEGVTVRRRRKPIQVRMVRGIPTTSIEQTLVAIAPKLPPKMLHRVFTRAWRKRLTTPKRVLRYLADHGGRGVPGAGKLHRVVALYAATDRAPGSDYEADLHFLLAPALKRARIEPPVLQLSIKIFDGRAVATVDFAWPERRKVVEVMGLDTHGDYEAQDYDYERAAELRAIGWDVLEIAPKAIRERPDQTVRRILTWLNAAVPRLSMNASGS